MRNRFALVHFGNSARRNGTVVLCLALGMFGAGLSAAAQGRKGTFITIDITGSGTGTLQGTAATGTIPWGLTVGNYFENDNVFQAFLRYPDGSITKFEAPSASGGALPLTP